MFTRLKSAISHLIVEIKEYIRDRDNIENYLSWGLESNNLEIIKLYNE
jgi:hypothetical protein